MPTIRSATEEDLPALIMLYEQLAIDEAEVERTRNPGMEDYRRILAQIQADPNHDLLVLEVDGEVVGTLVFLLVPNLSHHATPWALVENVVVEERQRGKGYGRLLMEHAIERAREAGCYKISLTSNITRLRAHRFYQSLGFKASARGFRMYF